MKFIETADESTAELFNSLPRPSGRIDNEVSVTALTRINEFDPAIRIVKRQGQDFNVIRERIRQIESKALRKLKNPVRGRMIKDFLEDL